jgi:serine/threonine protein kinase
MVHQKEKAEERIDQILKDTYRLERVLGEGGFGAVYEAVHVTLGRHFAVKVLHRHLADDANLRQRFETDARIAANLRHEHIVEAFDFGFTPDGAPFFTLEMLDGKELAAGLAGNSRLSLDKTASILDQVAEALNAAHSQGIVHRDLKPENIFLVKKKDRDDFVKLLDFGIARVIGNARITDGVIGSLLYMTPEQIQPPYDATARSDIFSLGAVVYECITGRRAFDGETAQEVLTHVLFDDPPPPSTVCADIPEAVDPVVLKALAKQREDRYQDVLAFAAAFRGACQTHKPLRKTVVVSSPRLVLRCEEGDVPGTRYNVTSDRASIGRADPRSGTPEIDLLAQEEHRTKPSVSRKHAEITLSLDGFQVVDLSHNGSWVNGIKLDKAKPHPLRQGDKLRVGLVVLIVDEAVGP